MSGKNATAEVGRAATRGAEGAVAGKVAEQLRHLNLRTALVGHAFYPQAILWVTTSEVEQDR